MLVIFIFASHRELERPRLFRALFFSAAAHGPLRSLKSIENASVSALRLSKSPLMVHSRKKEKGKKRNSQKAVRKTQ